MTTRHTKEPTKKTKALYYDLNFLIRNEVEAWPDDLIQWVYWLEHDAPWDGGPVIVAVRSEYGRRGLQNKP